MGVQRKTIDDGRDSAGKEKENVAEMIDTVWEAWTYDVWGNKRDGYEVNDRSCFARALPLKLKIQRWNIGTPQEFESAYPSDYQLKQVFGVGCKVETDGDDCAVYVTRASDGYPIGEMRCVSHESLSPIRRIAEEA